MGSSRACFRAPPYGQERHPALTSRLGVRSRLVQPIEWRDGRTGFIHDDRHVRHVIGNAEPVPVADGQPAGDGAAFPPMPGGPS